MDTTRISLARTSEASTKDINAKSIVSILPTVQSSTTSASTVQEAVTELVVTVQEDVLPLTRSCKTLQGEKCVFPFVFSGLLYHGCVARGEGGWCATSLTREGQYLTWGYCDRQNCSIIKSP